MTLRITLVVAVLLAVGATRLAAAPDNPIVLTAMQRDAAGVRALIAKGADVNVADGDGTTAAPLGRLPRRRRSRLGAARRRRQGHGGDADRRHDAAPHGGAQRPRAGSEGAAHAPAPMRREVNGNGTTVLMTAAGSGDAESVALLLAAGADVNAVETTNGQTALMFAAARNGRAAIATLLAQGANPDVTTKVVPLTRVLVDANGDPLSPEEAARLTARSASTDPRRQGRVFGATVIGGMTALHFAAREGHLPRRAGAGRGRRQPEPVSGGEQTSVARRGHHQRPSRHGRVSARQGRRPVAGQHRRPDRALRRARHEVASQHLVSAADRRRREDVVPGADGAAHRQGRRSERARAAQAVVPQVPLRRRLGGADRRDGVLARGPGQRRGGDAAAGRPRRRSRRFRRCSASRR